MSSKKIMHVKVHVTQFAVRVLCVRLRHYENLWFFKCALSFNSVQFGSIQFDFWLCDAVAIVVCAHTNLVELNLFIFLRANYDDAVLVVPVLWLVLHSAWFMHKYI